MSTRSALVEELALSRAERDALNSARSLDASIGAALQSSRAHRRATFLSLEKKGLVKEINAVLVDGDGWTIQPERWRPAFKLTERGRRLAQQLYREDVRAFHQADGRTCACEHFCAQAPVFSELVAPTEKP